MPEGIYYTPPPKRKSVKGGTGPRPQVWVSGPDIVKHEQYVAYIRHKAQADYRKEPYALTWEDWLWFWDQDDNWANRGRKNTAVVLTRQDKLGPWSRANCVIMTRLQHLIEHGKANVGKKYNKKPKEVK